MALVSLPEPLLLDFAAQCVADPRLFIQGAFPWQQAGTPLAAHAGPDTWQADVLEALGDHVRTSSSSFRYAVASGHGVGKAQPCEMVIDTPDGPRRFGDLQGGDSVFGSTGGPVRVVAVTPQGRKPLYRVTFDDRTSTLTCAEHLWTTRTRNDRRTFGDWQTLSTLDIMQRGVKRPNGIAEARQWEIPIAGALQYPFTWVPVEPYTLGVWLGDGSANTALITTMDEEVLAAITAAGYPIHQTEWAHYAQQGKAGIYSIGQLRASLRTLGVLPLRSYERYVPEAYKYNIVPIRVAVLQGLLDSDGFVDTYGKPSFSSSSELLAYDVAWLVRSLGGKARVSKGKQTGYRLPDGVMQPGRLAYVVTFTLPPEIIPFRIVRKAERYRPTSQTRYLVRWIDSIDVVGEETECQCITVEASDGLYVANDAIVTHNSALASFVLLWYLTTHPHPQVVVTANTAVQLATKTWRELAKWLHLSICAETFTWTATRCYHKQHPSTWFAAAVPWRADRPEAFAGTHEQHVLVLYDEASSIDDLIWETTEGAMTTPGAMWLAFGNPTRTSGRFRECFSGGRFAHRWQTRQVDSRQARVADQEQIAQWVTDYGDDSDFVRVRVKGAFPRQAVGQFISDETITQALARAYVPDPLAPTIVGVDVARYGDDRSVIVVRQGAKLTETRIYREIDTVRLSGYVCEVLEKYRTQKPVCCIDAVGLGAGVVDVCRARGFAVEEIHGGMRPQEPLRFSHKTSECWDHMRLWLETRACLDVVRDKEFCAEVTGREYDYDLQGKLRLEKKEDMKKRGLASPDLCDAVALTFAVPVAPAKMPPRPVVQPVPGLNPATSWMA